MIRESMLVIRRTLLLFIAFFACSCAGQCDDLDEEEQEPELISIGRAFGANWEALRSFDVLVTEEKFEIDPDGKTKEALNHFRQIADFDEQRFLFVGARKIEESTTGASVPQIQRAVHAFCYDGSVGEAWTRDIPHTPQKLLKTSLEKSLYASDFHDVRITGRLSGPRSFSDKMSIHDSFRALFSGSKRIWKRSEDAHSIEICVDVFLQGETGSRSVYTFDLTSFAPRALRTSAIRGSGERPESRETFEWQSINGVYVPIAVHGERIRARRDQGKMIEWTSTYELKFDWRSVNEGIDATLNVKPQVLNQTETLMKLVAPREQTDDLKER